MDQTLGFNPAPICQVPKCPHATSARVTAKGEGRKDLCARHAVTTYKFLDGVHLVAVWNELTLEDFDD